MTALFRPFELDPFDLLKKTRLARPASNPFKYYPNAGPARREGQASIDALASFTSEQQNNILPGSIPPSLPVYQVGDIALGGIIAYILQSGDPGYDANVQHGLVTTINNTSNTSWGCFGTLISGANGQAIGTGLQNSLDIVAECPDLDSAAKICLDLNEGGYTDWYLPSKDELFKMYENRVAIGGFLNTRYWSSSQVDASNAWSVNFLNSNQSSTQKNTGRDVRAVRSF